MKLYIHDPDKTCPRSDVAVRLIDDDDGDSLLLATVTQGHASMRLLRLSPQGIQRIMYLPETLGFNLDPNGRLIDWS